MFRTLARAGYGTFPRIILVKGLLPRVISGPDPALYRRVQRYREDRTKAMLRRPNTRGVACLGVGPCRVQHLSADHLSEGVVAKGHLRADPALYRRVQRYREDRTKAMLRRPNTRGVACLGVARAGYSTFPRIILVKGCCQGSSPGWPHVARDGAAAVMDEATAGGQMFNSQTADAGHNWRLFRSGVPRVEGPFTSPLVDGWDDLEERELDRGAEPGRPFLLRPDLTPDIDMLLYFASPRFRLLALQSQLGYATNIRVFLGYLESQGVEWREATEDHLLNYEYRRRRKPIQGQEAISGAAFARELAALNHFFGWQRDRGVIQESPVKLRSYRRHDGATGTTPRLRPRDVRSSNVKWLLPDAYRVWRSVGSRWLHRERPSRPVVARPERRTESRVRRRAMDERLAAARSRYVTALRTAGLSR